MTAKRGRPSSFTQEVANEICRRIGQEGQSLREVCRDPAMPDRVTVWRWLNSPEHENFRNQYAQARQDLLDYWADEITEIADDGTNDWIERKDKDEQGGYAFNGEHHQRSRLRIDTRKWLMSKLGPKKYGDRLAIDGDVKVTLSAEALMAEARSLGLSESDLFGR